MAELALVRPRAGRDQRIMQGALLLAAGFLALFLLLPLAWLLVRAFQDAEGGFVGLANFAAYVTTPALATLAARTSCGREAVIIMRASLASRSGLNNIFL
jgi:iron(III) transport system permease protein